jgi:hypothetical protein
MPYTDDEQTDPLTERSGSLLARQRERGGVPRIFQTNTSAEYWRGDCSLIHTDLAGTRDVEPPAEDRIYLFAGTQHSAGVLPLASVSAVDGARGVHHFNVVDYSPLSRAALTNLDAWAARGVEPPPSAFPRLADGTAVTAGEVLSTFAGFPTATLPSAERLPAVPAMRRYDLGPEAARGVGRFPVEAGERYPVFVSAVNVDGNEAAGVRLPDLTVPVASYAGWNPRHPETGGEGQILNMLGSTVPSPATAAERERTSDPRAAITERYRDRDDYLARVRWAAEELVAGRYLLEEDIEVVVQNCAARYDIFAPTPVPTGDSG